MNLVPFLLDGVRGAVILGAALAALPLARRAPASIRRALVLAALLSAFSAPLVARTFAATSAARAMALPFFVREPYVESAVEPIEPPPAVSDDAASLPEGQRVLRAPGRAPFVSWSTLLLAVWALGAAGVIARLGLGIHRARKLVDRARPEGADAFAAVTHAVANEAGVRADVVISDDIDAPVVTGMWRHVVLMPRAALAWTEERWRVVLLHELAHVARRDCLASILTQLACAMHWFDPLAWIARRRLRRERELAADEDVLATGTPASVYAAHLLAIATASRGVEMAGALGMTARPSELAERVEKLVSRERPLPASPALLPSVVVAVSATALAVACASPRPVPSPGAHIENALGEPTAANVTPNPDRAAAEQKSAAVPAAAAEGAALLAEVAQQLGVPSSRIELTIDPALQRIVDEELADLARTHRPVAATAIVLEPSKGELLAVGDAATARRAFVTGSTIKPVTVAAALEAGALRLDQKFDCRTRSVGGRTIEDGKQQRGLLDVAGIIEVSSNVGASRILDVTGRERFDELVARLHLAEPSTVELPNVARGDVPKTARLEAYDAAMVAIGEGLTATPFQMAAIYGAFANQGEYVSPTLVRQLRGASGETVSRRGVRERVMRAETAKTMIQLLERAVQGDQATGKRARLQGVRVAGKTGTAGWTTPDGKDHVYVSFVGLVPADAPRYVILVGAEDPAENGYAPVVAAPAFAKIAARVLGPR